MFIMATPSAPLVMQPTPERVCVLMADLVDSTLIARALSLRDYAALMSSYIRTLIAHFEAAGGYVLQHQGDAVLVVWPEECTSDAIAAALSCHERVASLPLAQGLGVGLQLRVGCSVGEVIPGVVGGQITMYGLPLNYSRRLCDAAAAGETLICLQAARYSGGEAMQMLRPLPTLQGFGHLSRAYTLVPPPRSA